MKRYFNVFKALSAAALLVAVSCERENFTDDSDAVKGRVVTRVFDAQCPDDDNDNPDSKTYLKEAGKKFVLGWRNNDQIQIVGATTSVTATLTNITNNNKKGSFTAKVTEGEQLYAIYPVASYAGLVNGNPVYFIPQSQTGLAQDATMMIAKDNSGSFDFRNVSTLFRFTLDVDMYPTVKKIRISPLGNQRLAGQAKVTFDDNGGYSVVANGTGLPTVTVDCSGEPYLGKVSVFATVIPQNYNGLKIELLNESGKNVRTVTYDRVLYADPNTVVDFGIISEHLDEYVFMATETFTDCNAAGGRDSNYSTCGDSLYGVNPDDKTDNNGWEFSNCFEANDCIRVGDNKTVGYAITPALGIETGRATVSFDMAKGGVGVPMNIFVVGNGIIDRQVVYAGDGKWASNTIYISGADVNTRLRFETVSDWTGTSNKYSFYLDNVKVIDGSPSFAYLNLPDGFNYVVEAEATELVNRLFASSTPVMQTPSNGDGLIHFTKSSFYDSIKKEMVNSFQENIGRDIRTAYMVVTTPDRLSVSFNIIQLGKTALFAKSDTLKFIAEGGTQTLKLDWWNFAEGAEITASSSNPQFSFTVNPADSSVAVTASVNETIDPVEAKMTVEMTDGKRTRSVDVVLCQEHGVVDQTLAFDPVSLSITVGTEYTLPVLSGAMTPVTYSIASDDAANPVATIDSETGELTLLGVDGTATVTASAEASEFYHSASATYTLTVTGNQKTQKIKFVDAQDETVTVSSLLVYAGAGIDGAPIFSDYQLPELSGAETSVTYSISNSDPQAAVATINPETGVLQLTGKTGTATITAVAAETNEWTSATANYTLKVNPMFEQVLAYNSTDGVVATSICDSVAIFDTEYYNLSIVKESTTNSDKNSYNSAGIRVPTGFLLKISPKDNIGIKFIECKSNYYKLSFNSEYNISKYSLFDGKQETKDKSYYLYSIETSNPTDFTSFVSKSATRISTIRILYYPTE